MALIVCAKILHPLYASEIGRLLLFYYILIHVSEGITVNQQKTDIRIYSKKREL